MTTGVRSSRVRWSLGSTAPPALLASLILIVSLAGAASGSVAPARNQAGPGDPGQQAARCSNEQEGPLLVQEQKGNIFVEGEALRVKVRCAAADRVDWSVVDFFGNEVATGRQRVVSGLANLTLNVPARGHFELTVRAYDGAASTSAASTDLAVLSPFDRPASSAFGTQTHFGKLNDASQYPIEIIPLLQRLGVTSVRDSVRWQFVEAEKGKHSFPPYFNQYVEALGEAGLDPALTLALYNEHYDDANTPYTEEGLTGFGVYAREVVRRYGDNISAVEVWNEPNGQGFTRGPAARDPVNYARMVEYVNRHVRQVNSEVPIFAGATTGIDLAWLEQAFAAGALEWADGVSAHHYPLTPAHREGDVPALERLIRQYNDGKSLPMWSTETGWPTFFPRDEATVARDLPKLLTIELAGGMNRVFWFNFMNNVTPPEEVPNERELTFGLIRSPIDERGAFVPKPSYASYATLIRQLSRAEPVGRENVAGGIRSYLFTEGGEEIRVLWADAGNQHVELSGRDLRVADLMGNNLSPLGQTDDGIIVKVTDDPIYLKGDVTGLDVLPRRYEAETLSATFTDGTTREPFDDPEASGGRGDKYNGTQVGDHIEYTVPVVAPGTYDVVVRAKGNPSRGIYQLAIDGTDQAGPKDLYAPAGYPMLFLGKKRFTSAGPRAFRFTAVGKNPDSSGYTFAADYIELIPSQPAEGTRLEAETLDATPAAGTTRELLLDTAMSGNYGDKYDGHQVGHFITYDVPVPAPGTYEVVVRVKAHFSRGIYQLAIDGADQGNPFDSYSGCCYPTRSLGTKTFTSADSAEFRFTAVGKNRFSTDYTLMLDYIQLVPVSE